MGESLNKLWQSWEIRLMVLSSLSLQIFLLAFAGRRRRVVSNRMSRSTSFSWRAPLGIILHWLLWLSYLSADFVATAALGYLSQYQDSNDGRTDNRNKHLLMFWAPFLLLHLGGQDTITALSIEDNELWLRHLLSLISEVGFAIYVYGKSNPIKGGLWPAAIPMFVAGFVKYAERTWSLQRASMSGLLNSVFNVPDPNPNYAMLMEEYAANREAGLPAKIISVDVSSMSTDDQDKPTKGETDGKTEDRNTSEYLNIVSQAFRSFQMFKGLFVDLIMILDQNWVESQKIFKQLENDDAYRVTEIELLLMYEMLHSKADLLHTWYGCAFRAVTLLCTVTALCIFAVHSKSGFGHIEIAITYVLLGGAVVLELVSVICMHVSIWTLATLVNGVRGRKLGIALLPLVRRVRPIENSLWSNQMGQFNLVDFAFMDKPCLWSNIMRLVSLKERWDHYRYTTHVLVSKEVKYVVLEELKSKTKMAVSDHRGQWTLLLKGHYNKLSWSVDCEFEKSVLIWHIATDLLFNTKSSPGSVSKTTPNPKMKSKPEVGQHISNYMLFLLILRPHMLPAGIGKIWLGTFIEIQFQKTCREARKIFTRIPDDDKDSPREMILGINTDHHDPSTTTDSMSVLFAGSKLALHLKDLYIDGVDAMWELINAVWVEMLCFAANKCRGQFHAKQMSQGGEFLTIIWMLMALLGLGDQCKVEENPIVKVVVEK